MSKLVWCGILAGWFWLGSCSFILGPIEECGNGVLEPGEECDIWVINNKTCAEIVPDRPVGPLTCSRSCRFDTSGCEAGHTGPCTLETVFFDSEPTCPQGKKCSLNQSSEPTCVSDDQFAGGAFYGACGDQGQCPFGSICTGASPADYSCMPFCSDTHPQCPGNGSCTYGMQQSTLKLCGTSDACNPIANTGCTPPNGCYIASLEGETICTDAGTVEVGGPCNTLEDCVPGALCVNVVTKTCLKLCDGVNPCPSTTCNTSVGLPNGWGVCP
jgi:hypothetical protein